MMCAYYAIEKIGKELVARELFTMIYEHYYWLLFGIISYALNTTKKEENAIRFYEFLKQEGLRSFWI